MPLYRYKAITQAGARVEGTQNAQNKKEIIELLRSNNQLPVSIDEVTVANQDLDLFASFQKVHTKDIAVFCRQFYTMLNAGVTILSSLDILKQQSESKKLKKVVEEIYESVQRGTTLSESMKEHPKDFPELLINMVAVGEVTGNLDEIMDRLATHFEKENRMSNKVKSALIYPMVLLVVSLSVVTFLLVFVMPTFVGMFTSSGVELPLPTRILLGVSNTLVHYGIFIFIGLVGAVFGIKTMAQSPKGKLVVDQMKLSIPVLKGVTQKIITTRFTRTLATLMASGVPLIQAIEVISRIVGNTVVERDLLHAISDLKKGVSLSIPIRDMGHFPPMVHYMLNIGEESGSIDDIMNRTANYYDEELDTALTRLVSLMEPLMILVMAVLVGSIAVAMVMPMFSMMDTING